MPETPRILLLATLAETGGAQAYVAQLVPALVGRFQVTVAAHGDGPLKSAAVRAGAEFVPLRSVRRPISVWRDTAGLVELFLLMRRLHPHIVHANSSKAGILGRIAAWLARVPIRIFTAHGWAFTAASHRGTAVYRLAERAVRPLTTVTVCVSESERQAGIAAGTCGPATSVVIPNGIDPGSRPRAHPEVEPPRVVTVGRLQAPKDPLSLVRALAELRATPVRTQIVGAGPDRAAVEAEIERFGLSETVEVAGHRDDVAEILAGSQIFVLSSRSEASPMAVLEAMAAGLPVIASRVGGLSELVVENETGLLVAPGDPRALAAAIGSLVENPALRARLGSAARTRVEQCFNLDAFLAAHLDLYHAQLASRALPAAAP